MSSRTVSIFTTSFLESFTYRALACSIFQKLRIPLPSATKEVSHFSLISHPLKMLNPSKYVWLFSVNTYPFPLFFRPRSQRLMGQQWLQHLLILRSTMGPRIHGGFSSISTSMQQRCLCGEKWPFIAQNQAVRRCSVPEPW